MYGKIGTGTVAGGGIMHVAVFSSAGMIVTTLVLIFGSMAVSKLLPRRRRPAIRLPRP